TDSEKILLDVKVQRQECCHSAGSIAFDSHGFLYLSVGDNTNPHNPGYYNSIDERPGREYWDSQRTSGNTNDLRGKVLRIKPEDDGSYSIPEGNLFPIGTENTRPEIYTMGCRNPYRISVDARRGWLFWGDVGQNTIDDPSRGPISYDEFNLATRPGFFGWPYFAGDNQAYTDFDFETNTNGPFYIHDNVLNTSKNNTGLEKLPAAQNAVIWYSYDESDSFPYLGTGGKSPVAGPFYYSDSYIQKPDWVDESRKFPDYYNGKVFFAEWMRDWINVATFTPEGKLDSIEQFMPSTEFVHPIDLEFGPDGALYVLEYGNNWFAASKDAGLYRIDFVEGNRKPTVRMGADKVVGASPLTVSFSSEGTMDLDRKDQLTYFWYFDDAEVQSKEANPTYTFTKTGTYQVKLVVEDNAGAINEEVLVVQVGNDLPLISVNVTENKTFYWNQSSFHYEINVEDQEDGSLSSGSIDVDNVVATLSYTSMYPDITMVAQEHENVSNYSHPGLELINKSDCKACHSQESTSVGPAYSAIAQRYKADKNAIEKLTQKVIEGGNGNWGETAMSAHPQLSEEDVREMVGYIVSLSGVDKKVNRIPLSGKIDVDLPDDEAGNYIFSVTYKDKGGQDVGPLISKKSFMLRPSRIKAVTCDDYEKVIKFNNQVIRFYVPEGYIVFKGVDLTSVGKIAVKYSSQNLATKVKIRTGSPDGEVIGEMNLLPTFKEEGATGATELNDAWANAKTQIEGVSNVKDVYITFEPLEETSTEGTKQCIIDEISFERN
ncbi:MAG: PQQ-dependent sugar dehydrogenase, partial [Cyclobacteriaceae bacterium]|nr:PQQ-dependent sugar dehydrogenase [Cyclobacteriaceae bacterium]